MSSDSINKQKSLLRSDMRKILNELDSDVKKAQSDRVFEKIIQNPSFIRAQNIFCFFPLPDEVDTRKLLDYILSLNKGLYLPRMGEHFSIECCRIRDIEKDLKPGAYGVCEPVPNSDLLNDLYLLDLLFIPGLAFDEKGRRLGRGLGYFDRFLARCSEKSRRVGLGFAEQKVVRIPVEKHDFILDEVILGS